MNEFTEDELSKIAAVSDDYGRRLREYDDSKFLKFLENYGLTIAFDKNNGEVILKNNKREARFSIFDDSWQNTPIDKIQLNAQAGAFLSHKFQTTLLDARDSLIEFSDAYGFDDLEEALDSYIAASVLAWELRKVLPNGEFTNFVDELEYITDWEG